jgi:hypothetical protein
LKNYYYLFVHLIFHFSSIFFVRINYKELKIKSQIQNQFKHFFPVFILFLVFFRLEQKNVRNGKKAVSRRRFRLKMAFLPFSGKNMDMDLHASERAYYCHFQKAYKERLPGIFIVTSTLPAHPPCVQQRLVCSAGVSPARVKTRAVPRH